MNTRPQVSFDVDALFAALDTERTARGLSWSGVAREIWDLSAVLNARRGDHPISPSTLTNLAVLRRTSCQHALFMLRWLARTPESFLTGARADAGTPLARAGPDQRLRWSLSRLYQALDVTRRERSLTWVEVARELGCGTSQLTGLRTAKFAIDMDLAMRIVQWLERSASDFIDAANW